MIRRTLLCGATALPLIGCAAAIPIAAWAADAATLASGVAAIVPQLGQVTGFDPAPVQLALQQAAQLAQKLSTITNPQVAQSTFTEVTQAIEAAIAALGPYTSTLPAPLPSVLQAIQVLLPILAAAVGAAVAPKATMAGLTPDEARLILKGAAAK